MWLWMEQQKKPSFISLVRKIAYLPLLEAVACMIIGMRMKFHWCWWDSALWMMIIMIIFDGTVLLTLTGIPFNSWMLFYGKLMFNQIKCTLPMSWNNWLLMSIMSVFFSFIFCVCVYFMHELYEMCCVPLKKYIWHHCHCEVLFIFSLEIFHHAEC